MHEVFRVRWWNPHRHIYQFRPFTGGAPSRASYIRARVATLGPGEHILITPAEPGITEDPALGKYARRYAIMCAQIAIAKPLTRWMRGSFATAQMAAGVKVTRLANL